MQFVVTMIAPSSVTISNPVNVTTGLEGKLLSDRNICKEISVVSNLHSKFLGNFGEEIHLLVSYIGLVAWPELY